MRVGDYVTKLAIVGSRDYPRLDLVTHYVQQVLHPGVIIVSGGARGVDSVAAQAAWGRRPPLLVEEYEAEWNLYGHEAGFIRNTIIVDKANAVVAYWDGESRGTLDTIQKARAAGKLAWVVGPQGNLIEMGPHRDSRYPA